MRIRALRLATLLILTLVLILSVSLPVFAAKPNTLYTAIDNGGDRLAAIQGPNSGLIPYNWEWVAGDGNFDNANLQGITAVGLLAAYEKTKNRTFLAAAKNSGNILKQRYAAAPTARPYAQDVEFLVRLYTDTRDKSYLDTAKNWYKVVTVDFTAEANIARLITARGSLAGWDAAAHIRAANAAGFKTYATDMAKELIKRSADWVNVPYPGTTDNYTTLSYGSFLWALGEIGGSFTFHATIDSYRDFLVGYQDSDGSWEGDFQTTAYVVLGLDAVKGFGKDTRAALNSAVDYLLDNQAANGGWVYTGDGEYPEVNAECVMALADLGEFQYMPHQFFPRGHGGFPGHHFGFGFGHGPRR
jgi:hypothetical protein